MSIPPISASKFLLLLVISVSLVIPAYAANDTLDLYTIVDQPYTPLPLLALVLAIGLLFLILSLTLSAEQNNDAFAVLAVIPLFMSAWMSLQIDIPKSGMIGDTTFTLIRTQHYIYPSMYLAVVCFILGIVAVLQVYRLMTTSKMQEPTSGRENEDGESHYQEDDYHEGKQY
jgi:hypothetical protein